ncbi:Hpt domain-containing protein [Alteromonas ponticola]|uniref:Hpt domain-containing protein n=1 Tax=Alteromonas aquimaris TaxID=2998417 RepID=A0ABT3P4L6_9ALTE|nr:Hpt domain-containing protein [Alteromonas aquimaris]MCW8107710.1 Hpt domain-containing protein [Alteromonas aquimaris]
MSKTQTIIDLEFGTAQLSGNKSLLLTLLNKFADEYRDTEHKLNNIIESEDWESARILVHTLKGVTGNLGINALHEECKEIEGFLKDNSTLPPSYPQFLSILRETLAMVSKLNAEPDVASATNSDGVTPPNQDKEDFLRALRNSEFIPEDQLDKWVNAATDDPQKQQSIKEAVDELDYQAAIELLND